MCVPVHGSQFLLGRMSCLSCLSRACQQPRFHIHTSLPFCVCRGVCEALMLFPNEIVKIHNFFPHPIRHVFPNPLDPRRRRRPTRRRRARRRWRGRGFGRVCFLKVSTMDSEYAWRRVPTLHPCQINTKSKHRAGSAGDSGRGEISAEMCFSAEAPNTPFGEHGKKDSESNVTLRTGLVCPRR